MWSLIHGETGIFDSELNIKILFENNIIGFFLGSYLLYLL